MHISDEHILVCGSCLIVMTGVAVLLSEVLYLLHVHQLPDHQTDVLHDDAEDEQEEPAR